MNLIDELQQISEANQPKPEPQPAAPAVEPVEVRYQRLIDSIPELARQAAAGKKRFAKVMDVPDADIAQQGGIIPDMQVDWLVPGCLAERVYRWCDGQKLRPHFLLEGATGFGTGGGHWTLIIRW